MDLSNWTGDKITIRPSSVDTFFSCPYQWASVFIGGEHTIPGARAAIGTAVHEAAEVLWTEAILTKQKDANITKLNDAAIIRFQEQDKEGIQYDKGEDLNTAEAEVLRGVETLVSDIVPFADIPLYTEQRFTIDIDHPVVERVSGTVDYISHDTLADLKTSRKKPVPQSHVTQQSIYKMLAEAEGHKVQYSTVQGIAFTKVATGYILPLEPNIPRAKHLINTILDVLDVFYEGKVDPKILFRGNPKYFLCSDKYCTKHSTCPFVQGDER